MDAAVVLRTLTSKGCRLIPDGELLRIQDPQQALTDDLRAAIRQYKPALLGVLTQTQEAQSPPKPLGTVGRHGAPCPQCGDTWQWPTTSGEWVCSWCVAGRPGTPQVAPGRTVDTTRTLPDAVRAIHGADGRVWTVTIYRCPQCGGARHGPTLENPDVWHCLDCHPDAPQAAVALLPTPAAVHHE